MKLAVLSGKGGAGKTLIAVNLASAAGRAAYIDCDVEEPNGRLFWKPDHVTAETVYTLLPSFDPEKCTGCRKCVAFCKFHALIYVREKPMVFSEVCHSCGGCAMVCPEGAIHEMQHPVGQVEEGTHNGISVITGVLNPGEASGVPVIRALLQKAPKDGLTVIDCPPGSACSVMESVSDADYCLLVAEPTAFGFHNFKMVHELSVLLGKPCGVVVNKEETPYEPLESYCKEHSLPILMRIPYRKEYAQVCAAGKILCEEDGEAARLFSALLEKVGGACI